MIKTENCAKCENTSIKDVYNAETDNLDRLCLNCGYTWTELSADKQGDTEERVLTKAKIN